MRKCKECKKPLKYFYFNIGGIILCSNCASELINDIDEFKVNLSNISERREK